MDLVMKLLLVVVFAGLGTMLLVVGVSEFFAHRRGLAGVQSVEAVVMEARINVATRRCTRTGGLRAC
jgi:hypothetical protein